ncbi:hypothetical protein [Pyxidicoccus xibeiensis]|uniref:hypothetical protein n=1 Tax=Pyxidicoccus xibeiensis TaxID=2906759 RepID=UPI0020A75C7E|nr:hypothetical protein [Pyxidicoccus xibeiensis]MCP3136011.1 hypothetical protein [Pyxidicoccus xibeiensis]
MSAVEIILIGALGSALQELLHWYSLREHLATERYKRLIKSVPYWIVTGLMIIGAGVAVYLWFAGEGDIPARQYLITGAALPLIFKKAVEAVTGAKAPAVARRDEGTSGSLVGTYFGAGTFGRGERLA